MNHPLDFEIIIIEGIHKKMACFIPQKRPLTNQIHLQNDQSACVIH
jgi:hypothetical protein